MIIILTILFTHFISDFIFQTDEQAINKSKSNFYLTQHVFNYMVGLWIFACAHLAIYQHVSVAYWVAINAVLHWITDYFTSRLNSYFWRKEMRHWFFVGIGADQMIHYTCLLLTWEALGL